MRAAEEGALERRRRGSGYGAYALCRTVISGTVRSIIVLVLGMPMPAAAGKRGDWFESLLQPDGTSCCDVSDCKKTVAEWHKDRWWANVQGKWRVVPTDRVLSEPISIDGQAYVCSAKPVDDDTHEVDPHIYCFVPPSLGF